MVNAMARHSIRCTPRASRACKIYWLHRPYHLDDPHLSQQQVPHIEPEPMPGQIGTKPQPPPARLRRYRCSTSRFGRIWRSRVAAPLRAALVDRRPHLRFVSVTQIAERQTQVRVPTGSGRRSLVSAPVIKDQIDLAEPRQRSASVVRKRGENVCAFFQHRHRWVNVSRACESPPRPFQPSRFMVGARFATDHEQRPGSACAPTSGAGGRSC